MIPAHIEKLVHEGKAKIKTYCGGVGQAFGFQIPVNKYGVLLHLTYYPYYSDSFSRDETQSKWDSDCVSGLWIRSDKNSSHFVVRPYRKTLDPIPAEVGTFPSLMPIQFPMYMVVENQVKFTTTGLTRVQDWLNFFDQLDPLYNEPAQPVGVGVAPAGFAVVRFADIQPPFSYTPQSQVLRGQPSLPGQPTTYEFQAPVKAGKDPSTADHQYSYPIVQVLYAVLDGKSPNLS